MIPEAVQALAPEGEFIIRDDELIWLDDIVPRPSDTDIANKEAEILANRKREKLKNELTDYIYSNYPQSKQNSDVSDKMYYETVLKASGETNIEANVMNAVLGFFSGKTLDEVLLAITTNDVESYEQLIKIGIRVTWVIRCKQELKRALAEDRDPIYPKMPLK